MVGKPPVNISLPVHIVVKLVKILLCQKAAGIGLPVPLLVDGIVYSYAGVHALHFIIDDTECLDIIIYIVIQRRGIAIPP